MPEEALLFQVAVSRDLVLVSRYSKGADVAMARRFIVGILSLALVVTSSLLHVERVMAAEADKFTLPFYQLGVGIVRNFSAGHTAIDYSMVIGTPVAAARAGIVVATRQADPDGGECDPSTHIGNYVLLRHPDLTTTVYLHLKQNGVLVAPGQQISAGQKVALSGNSGKSCAPHLHYQYNLGDCWNGCGTQLNPAGDWTTADPGKVPWHGAFEGLESHPSGYTTFEGISTTVWVQFRNDGGRSWSATNPTNGNGRIFLAAVTSTAGTTLRNSLFSNTPDWETGSIVGRADQSLVAPGSSARFTFIMRAPSVGGTVVFSGATAERFNLVANGLFFFNYYGCNPGICGYWLGPITVQSIN